MPHKFYSSPAKLKLAPVYFVSVIMIAVLPVLLVFIASYFAEANNCILNEAGAHPCIIGSTNYGNLFSVMFVFGWLMLVTIPGGLVALVWLAYVTIHDARFHSGKHRSHYDNWLEQIKSK